MKLSIIIPVFNEEKTVPELLKRVERLKIDGVDKEVIVVDDGSSDHSVANIKYQKSPPEADRPLDEKISN